MFAVIVINCFFSVILLYHCIIYLFFLLILVPRLHVFILNVIGVMVANQNHEMVQLAIILKLSE